MMVALLSKRFERLGGMIIPSGGAVLFPKSPRAEF